MRISLAISLLLGATATIATDCSSGQLGQLVALLEDYTPALSYCAMLIPTTTTTPRTTTTITQCRPEATQQALKRQNIELDNYKPSDSQSAAFAKLKRSKQASYDVCTCIANNSPTKVYITKATCSSTQYCDVNKNVCVPKRNCKNPARCESDSYVASGDCFCHPDTEDSTLGYCMTTGPGCPSTYEDCGSNADCGSGSSSVCIFACCREEPFCVDLGDYEPGTSATSSRKLFRRVLDDRFSSVNPRWL